MPDLAVSPAPDRGRARPRVPAAPRFGWFGKIPGTGDFVRRGLSPGFVAAWDDWQQGLMREARAALGEDWGRAYYGAPIWRFALAPGLCGPRGALGVMMPSVDRVGREFPLTLAVEVEAPAWRAFLASPHLPARLETAALEMLDPGAATSRLDQVLSPLRPPLDGPALRADPTACGAPTLRAAPPPAGAALAGLDPRPGHSIWAAELDGGLHLLCCPGLPSGPRLARAIFDASAPCWAPAAPARSAP